MHQEFTTFEEIVTQTEAWLEAIAVVEDKADELAQLDLDRYQQVLFTGCGSTYYLSLAGSSLLQAMTGAISKALPSSESLLHPESVFCKGRNLLIAVSRSGLTTETLQNVKRFKNRGLGEVVTITNYGDSPLAHLGDINIVISAGREKSVAQTRSFASMLVAITALSYSLGPGDSFAQYEDDLVDAGTRLIRDYQDYARVTGIDPDVDQVFYLGSGPLYGLASEGSLKMKEMSQTVTEPFHSFEFRHGPISMVDGNTLVVGLMSQRGFYHEQSVLEDARSFGAKTVTVGEENTDVEFASGLPEQTRGVLYLPVLQLLAYFRAVSSGKNPDDPQNITSVVELDLDISSPQER
jgi:glucosamine--fructose-6-phosphate aminotransferase (isomerizing)